MHEVRRVERDADMQILAAQVQEHEITGSQCIACDRHSRMLLFLRGTRHGDAGVLGGIAH